jgi:hypothetical protein
VAGYCEHGDEPSGSGATELVSYLAYGSVVTVSPGGRGFRPVKVIDSCMWFSSVPRGKCRG